MFGSNEGSQLGVGDKVIRKPVAIPTFEGMCIKQAAVSSFRSIYVTCGHIPHSTRVLTGFVAGDGQVLVGGANVSPDGSFSINGTEIAKTPVLVKGLVTALLP